ncbi:MAG: hypothetical protein VB082_08335 [Christensenella sp.]|nr:hypothetical protein [Christensenella sp.]
MLKTKLEPWQRKKLFFWIALLLIFATVYLGATSFSLYADKKAEDDYWNYYLNEADSYTADETAIMEDATQVTVGTYVETMNAMDMKNSKFTVTFRCWFSWEGREDFDPSQSFEIYNGTANKVEILRSENLGTQHYQLLRVNATVSKSFWTVRFPVGSYQFRFYLKPTDTIENLVFVPDTAHSGINDSLNLSGFKVARNATGLCIIREDPEMFQAPFDQDNCSSYSEVMTAFELNRDSWGLYLKCIIALIGTNAWVLISLFVCTYHKVDSLAMIPAILFGTVSNILVGANLIPDAMYAGLLEYVNIWGIYIILISSLIIVNINRIRNEHQDEAFAKLFGRCMFTIILATTVLGYLLLPCSAYRF